MQLCSGAARSEGKMEMRRGLGRSERVCVCAWECDLLQLCCIAERISCASSAIACLSYRISSSEFTVPIRESLCLNKASFVRKCHRSACIRCKIECPSSTKTCKAMPGYQQWGFSPRENRWSEWKRPVIMEKKFFQPAPHAPPPLSLHCSDRETFDMPQHHLMFVSF